MLFFQTTVTREVALLNGNVDLPLIFLAAWGINTRDRSGYYLAIIAGALVAFITALPWYIYLAAYLSVIILARFVLYKLWESPLLSMLTITLASSVVLYLLTIVGLRIDGIVYPLDETLNRVIIPSIFSNLFVAIPMFAIVKDFSRWFYRSEEAA